MSPNSGQQLRPASNRASELVLDLRVQQPDPDIDASAAIVDTQAKSNIITITHEQMASHISHPQVRSIHTINPRAAQNIVFA